jgi:predicted DNA-binding transcriptional regulator AlpA
MQYLLANLSELAELKAKNIREEAQMWDVLSRDLKRAQKEQESLPPPTYSKVPPIEDVPALNDRLYVRIKEAQKIMGMCRTALYNEIKESRLPVKKMGRSTLIAVADIHTWFDRLPNKP